MTGGGKNTLIRLVSIPKGAVKSRTLNLESSKARRFQFQKVQLKGSQNRLH